MCHQNYSWDYGYSVATDDDDDDNNNNNSDYFFSTLKNKSAISSKTRIKIIKSQKVIIFESTRVTLSYLTHYLLQKKKHRFVFLEAKSTLKLHLIESLG